MAKRTRILHLDDDSRQTRIFEMLLRDEKDFQHVGSLHDSSKLLDEIVARRPDILVMDLKIHKEDSIETIRKVRARFRDLKIVLFSGFDDPQILADARAAGATTSITKGSDLDDVLAGIRKTISVEANGRSFYSGG